MGYTVLKAPSERPKQIEVVGEFSTEEEARQFAKDAAREGRDDDSDYSVECPPSKKA